MLWQIGHLDQAFELGVGSLVASGEVSTSTTTTATSPVWACASNSSGASPPASSTATASLVAAGRLLVSGAGIVTAGVEIILAFALGGQIRVWVHLGSAPALASGCHLASETSSPASSSLASGMRLVPRPQVIVTTVGDATSV